MEYLTTEMVAVWLSVSAQTIRRWANSIEGFPKPITFGRRTVRWRYADVERYASSMAGDRLGDTCPTESF
jgi:predicted DNA-binding transcriptional regulator AlpA